MRQHHHVVEPITHNLSHLKSLQLDTIIHVTYKTNLAIHLVQPQPYFPDKPRAEYQWFLTHCLHKESAVIAISPSYNNHTPNKSHTCHITMRMFSQVMYISRNVGRKFTNNSRSRYNSKLFNILFNIKVGVECFLQSQSELKSLKLHFKMQSNVISVNLNDVYKQG